MNVFQVRGMFFIPATNKSVSNVDTESYAEAYWLAVYLDVWKFKSREAWIP
jgi:hypothetical protein